MPRGPAGRPVRRRPPAVRRARRTATRTHRARILIGRLLMVLALLVAGGRLVQVQGFEATALSSRAEQQRSTTKDIPAERGSILDRNGTPLAFSQETRALGVLPRAMKKTWTEEAQKDPSRGNFETHTAEISATMHQVLGDAVNEQELLAKLRADTTFVYLADNVDPAKAAQLTKKFPDVGAEYRAIREYPQGPVGSNIVGMANWRKDQQPPGMHGISGLESSLDNVLSGSPGRMVLDTEQGNNDVVIPGSERDLVPATPGADVQLTIDTDVQYTAQHLLADYVRRTGARDGSMVVMDAHTGEVYALANDTAFDPNSPVVTLNQLANPAVTTPYEPGSVNKVVTAAAGIEYGVVKPDTVVQVPGELPVADRVIHDAWPHGTINLTFTGVLARSSNIGTVLIAQKVGRDRFADLLHRLGLGERTGIGLPGESPGSVPPRNQWSGSTFGNLPIGQGLSMTVLQMAGMYQAIANDGVRVPPRVVQAEIKPDGTRQEEPRPAGVRVVSPDTARTVRDMLRAVTQDAPGVGERGTGTLAALPGYQISGKTGTAQQVDPNCGCYSDSKYWITFAGMLPADNPRFVIGVMLDAPDYSRPEGRSAAPIFHDMASYLAQRYQIPVSPQPSPVVPLTVQP
jgi:cell division protein FtsI (penicillin-binding protein 3)